MDEIESELAENYDQLVADKRTSYAEIERMAMGSGDRALARWAVSRKREAAHTAASSTAKRTADPRGSKHEA
jgi:hypothetical protein